MNSKNVLWGLAGISSPITSLLSVLEGRLKSDSSERISEKPSKRKSGTASEHKELPKKLADRLSGSRLKAWKANPQLLVAATSLALAAANADGEISNDEMEIVDALITLAKREFSQTTTQSLIDLKKMPPTFDETLVYLKKIRKIGDLHFMEALVDQIARSDGNFCVKEKEFLDRFRIETGLACAVPVVATMSSGKSTLINAMLGSPLLPAENQACTSTILKLENQPSMEQPYGRKTCPKLGVSDWQPVCAEELKAWNNEVLSEIELLGSFPNINNHRGHAVLYDTPGPNNAMNQSHGELTKSILQKIRFGQVVVVLNSRHFAIDDEYSLLQDLLPLKENKVRFLFALNKFDCIDLESESPLKFISKVRNRLNGIDFKRPILIPTMSKLSLDLRTLLSSPSDTPLDWSNRRQKGLLRTIEYLDQYRSIYLDTICHTKTNQRLYDKAEKNNCRGHAEQTVTLCGQELSSSFLRGIDMLTGIPLIEASLEYRQTKKNN